MRVLVTINCHGVDASAEGGLALARMLDRGGHTVLVQTRPGGPVAGKALEWGLETSGPFLRKAAILTGLPPFAKLLRRFSPDVICSTRAEGQTAAVIAAPGVPLVRVRCDIRKPSSGRLWRYVDRRTDLVVFPSPFMLERGYEGERSGPVAVIPHPVDTDRFRGPGEVAVSGSLLVSIGRLSPMKGHRTLIRALSLLPEDVRAVIAGPPSQQSRRDLLDLAFELGVEHRLDLPGNVDDPADLISTARAGVVTSLGSEVVSRSGMEMMSCGLPLLAAATNGLTDLVGDGVTGMLHSPGNHRQLAAQAEFLLNNPSLAESMGRKARRLCVERYSFGAVAGEWESVLSRIAGREQFPR
ncbi:MAG: hypothetical protein AVO35_03610 [Candidatus Aegiribacteria sp. MLS_C]|nr:MAG: hypothetical protein AVO35_03610 [Candidatus Aegiribacteria sp. MLS_C]